MTGIAIFMFNFEQDGPDVRYETISVGQPLRQRGDVGLEYILSRIPTESFRSAMRAQVTSVRDLMLQLPKGAIYHLDVLFDIGRGFYFRFLNAVEPLLFDEARDAVAMLAPASSDRVSSIAAKEVEDAPVDLVDLCDTDLVDIDDAEPPLEFVSETERRFELAGELSTELTMAISTCVEDFIHAFDFSKHALRWPSEEEVQAFSLQYTREIFNGMILPPGSGAVSIAGPHSAKVGVMQ
ncbi:hypothetical protein SB748_28985 [Rhizobium sp. SIMBA_035]